MMAIEVMDRVVVLEAVSQGVVLEAAVRVPGGTDDF